MENITVPVAPSRFGSLMPLGHARAKLWIINISNRVPRKGRVRSSPAIGRPPPAPKLRYEYADWRERGESELAGGVLPFLSTMSNKSTLSWSC